MPWFEDNILLTVYVRVLTYLLSDIFIPIFILILLSLFGLTYALKKNFNNHYDFLFPPETTPISLPSLPAILFILVSFLIYVFMVYWLNGGAFSNYDIMNDSFRTGTWQQYGFLRRLNPLVFIDLTILYGITHNYYLINLYVIIIHALCLYLLYRLIDNVSSSKKLYILGVLTFIPAYFWTNNIVFTERLMLIYILASFICLKNWVKTKHIPWILGYLFWMNMALYTKENNVILYFAFTVVILLKSLYDEKLTLSSFIHPIRSIKQFPLEFLNVLSIFFFSIQHTIVVQGIKQNTYYIKRFGTMFDVMNLYAFELGIIFVSLVFILLKKPKVTFWTVMYFSSIICAAFVIVYLRLISTGYTSLRTYFVAVPVVFIVVTWLKLITKPSYFFTVVVILLLGSAVMNNQVLRIDKGRDTLEMAQFFKTRAGTLKLILGYNFEDVFWTCKSWTRAFKSYMPSRDLLIKGERCSEELFETADNYSLVNQYDISRGDYYIVRKERNYQKDLNLLSNFKTQKIFENKIYDIYYIQDKTNAQHYSPK